MLCVNRSTISLVLPVPIVSNEQTTSLETILSIDDTKRSSSVELIEQKRKGAAINKYEHYFPKEIIESQEFFHVEITTSSMKRMVHLAFVGQYG